MKRLATNRANRFNQRSDSSHRKADFADEPKTGEGGAARRSACGVWQPAAERRGKRAFGRVVCGPKPAERTQVCRNCGPPPAEASARRHLRRRTACTTFPRSRSLRRTSNERTQVAGLRGAKLRPADPSRDRRCRNRPSARERLRPAALYARIQFGPPMAPPQKKKARAPSQRNPGRRPAAAKTAYFAAAASACLRASMRLYQAARSAFRS